MGRAGQKIRLHGIRNLGLECNTNECTTYDANAIGPVARDVQQKERLMGAKVVFGRIWNVSVSEICL